MKDKKKLIIILIAVAILIVILICNFFNKDITNKPGELIGDAVGSVDFSKDRVVRGSLDDPDSNINKLLNLDPNREIEIVLPEQTEMDSSYSIKYTDVKGDKLGYKDYSESAKTYLAYDSFTGIYVLNVLGRICKENNIELSSMMLGEDLVPKDPNYSGVCFESNKYKISIFYLDNMSEANIKLEVIG